VLIGLVVDPVAAGGYFVASRIANAFSMISGGLNSYSTRRISSDYYQGGTPALIGVLRTLGLVTAALVGAGACSSPSQGRRFSRSSGRAMWISTRS